MEQKKRRHHYVWRYHLESWSLNGTLFCLRDGEIITNNPRNFAVKKDFYRLPELNAAEIQFLLAFAKKLPQRGSTVVANFIRYFSFHSQLSQYESLLSERQDITQHIDTLRSNLEEDYHTAIENSAIPIIQKIKNGDVSFYSDQKECACFMYFVALQLLRTKKMSDAMAMMPENAFGIDLRKTWPAQRHMVASNFGCNLFLERHEKPITMVHNDTSVEFITSDQPVINLYPDEAKSNNVLAVFYPVSPKKAVIFGDLKVGIPRPEWRITSDEAMQLNKTLALSSHEMLFASSHLALKVFNKENLA
jgi:hypothetical protein